MEKKSKVYNFKRQLKKKNFKILPDVWNNVNNTRKIMKK